MEPEEKLVFNSQWFQSEASVMHDFLLNFFPKDNSLELIDNKSRKSFLRRTKVDTVCLKDLFPGARIYVFGRKINILDYGNMETNQLLGNKSQRAFLLLAGQSKRSIYEVFQKISSLNLNLINCFMKQLSSEDLIRLPEEQIAAVKYNLLNEPAVLFEVSGRSVDKKVEDIKETLPSVFGSLSEEVLSYFFKDQVNKQLIIRKQDDPSVLCLIKPHVVHANQTGDLIAAISKEGFEICNIKLCHFDRHHSDEFLRVYEGIIPEFIQISIHLASGPFLALQLTNSDGEDIHGKLRNLCGPSDPEIAKKLRPHTLRAEFGINIVCNAVHCTDLKEDVQLELDFFFG